MNDYILNAIGNDWEKTGRCDLYVAKERFLFVLLTGFVLQKDSPYTEYFSRGYVMK
jgi:hypothetical protein